ncbi:hypothetical protein FHX10_003377 [Rhizobium sp. BK591]|uniref:hypothetical protein n=1 Tax=Rhizobium sp. BK591 TaxID=2586985 RepID=UPI00161C09D3|nr:hypothetical protein [Rhizobium sp. BK591]MBB3743878.1 hypothetical protein [Rhizobium sp. BK591]
MTRKPADVIAHNLREIRQDKILTVDANGAKRSQEWRERYARHIEALGDAIEGFDNLARAQAEKQNGGAA